MFENTVLSTMKQDYGPQDYVTKILVMSYSDLPLPPKVMLPLLEYFSRELYNLERSSDPQMD